MRIGDTQLDETHSFINTLFDYKPGDKVQVEVERGNNTVDLTVTLGEGAAQQ